MSSEAKIAANQAAAKLSTGPVTEAGKQTVSGNALKHGLTSAGKHAILPGERAEYEKLLQDFLAHYRPAGPEENRLVVNIAENTIRVRRAHAMEAALFEQAILEKEDSVDAFSAQAQAWNDASKGIQRIALYAHRIERAITKDSAKLDALQSARKVAHAKAQEEAILLMKLARAKGNAFDPASHFPPDCDFGGFVYSAGELACIVERDARLEEARARFAPTPKSAELTMRQLEALIG
jgi:hypothetical protein